MQWAIFGIKSATKGNPQNQEYIKKMQAQGVVNNDFLRESHVECRLEDGKIKMRRTTNDDASLQ